ncbi:MAG: Calx-beta domain-containing protein [Anaerolineae bacterium]
MNHSKTFSRTLAMKGGFAIVIAAASLLYFSVLFTLTAAAPQAAVCVSPSNLSVSSELELNDAIECFNQEVAAGTYVITFTQSITLSASTLPITNTVAGADLEINGEGFTLDGENTPGVRPLAIYADADVTISELIVTGGNITGTDDIALNHGGGIQNFGTLTLIDSQVISNAASATNVLKGGGIYNDEAGTLIIQESSISENSAGRDGGGIENRGVLTLTDSIVSDNTAGRFSGGIGIVNEASIIRSTIENNHAVREGGGIYNNIAANVPGGSINIVDSIFANNTSNRSGGGIYNDTNSGLNLSGSTVSGNIADADAGGTAGDGGGLYLVTGAFGNIENTTISGNSDGTSGAGGVSNAGIFTFTHVSMISNTGTLNFVNSGTAHLINSVFAGNAGFDCSNTGGIPTNSGNLIQTNDNCPAPDESGDPELDPLNNNGGLTPTHLPRAGSPVIGATSSSCLATDQRGVIRSGGSCEMGAVELIDTMVSVADASVTEGTGGTTVITFTLTRTDMTNPVTVTVNTVDDSAVAGSDYTALVNEDVVFDAGIAIKQVGITVATDSQVEADETFTVTLSNPINASISDGSATGTINNDDTATVTLSGAASVEEGDAGTVSYVFTATLSAAVDGGFDVDVSTADGTATTADNDYNPITSTLNFVGTANEAQTISVAVVGDMVAEFDETFSVSFGTITNTMLASDITAGAAQVGTINDDDGVSFSLDVGSVSVTEADTTVPVTVTLSASSAVSTSVMVGTSEGSATAGVDFVALSETLEFAAGEITKTVTITINDDMLDELDETFDVALSAPVNASLGSPSDAMITIVDNDGTPGVSIENTAYSVDESGGALDVVLTLTNVSGLPVSVTVKTTDQTAEAGSDYAAIDEVVVFAAGDITQTLSVSVTNDTLYEGDEIFTLTISDPVNGVLSTNTVAIVTIKEDDALPQVTIQDVTQAEGDATGVVTFTISLDKAVAVPVSVGYMTQDDTATVIDGDYSAKSGTLSIAVGETSGTVEVTVNGDTTEESDEAFVLILTTVSNGTLDSMLSGRTGTATLTNDDIDPTTSFTIFLPLIVK